MTTQESEQVEARPSSDKRETSKPQKHFSVAVAEAMTLLAENYRQDITREQIEVYYRLLASERVTVEELEIVIPRLMKRCKFFPNVTEVLDERVRLRHQRAGYYTPPTEGPKCAKCFDTGWVSTHEETTSPVRRCPECKK